MIKKNKNGPRDHSRFGMSREREFECKKLLFRLCHKKGKDFYFSEKK
jgi:hypothetical protein